MSRGHFRVAKQPPPHARAGQPDRVGGNGHHPGLRPATPNQVRTIETIARDRGVDLTHVLHTKFDSRRTDELTIVDASLLIDFLKSLSSD
jgi:hypothetical protein